MLYPTPTEQLLSGGFINGFSRSVSDPLIAVSHFDLAHFHDDLLTQFAVPLPATLQRAVNKRKAEYLASRLLVRNVLADFGHPNFLLTNAPDRSPRWPDNLNASLSHSQGIAVLAVTRQALCVGVDVEHVMAEKTAQETARMLMNQEEQQRLASLPLTLAEGATLLFSLKESLYKALWPKLHEVMDFHQAALVEIDLPAGKALLRLEHHFNADFPRGTLLEAAFTPVNEHVITLVTYDANKKPAQQVG
ncbi:4'-phosphopantetheinyl transferase family protein [Pantoea sp. A4]|uniref:4'-phosphopantetheinyl transferase family protein n=1 Tax=Pantoea sp. A4 TaxID=1225184 RepID=UPI00037C056F|nr:4'-phosphopantetheinyl transferase superfamily protein [Pantoea sp. A4]